MKLHPIIELGDFPAYNLISGSIFILCYFEFQSNSNGFFENKDKLESFTIKLAILMTFSFLLGGFLSSFLYTEIEISFLERFYKAGFTYLLGLSCFLLGVFILVKVENISWTKIYLLIVPCIMICNFLGRIACSLAGCCYGIEVEIYETIFLFPSRELESLYSIVYFAYFKYSKKLTILEYYIPIYCILRFFLEYMRADDRGNILGFDTLSPSQIICIVLFFTLYPRCTNKRQMTICALPPPWSR
jgi:phosphatidylglycerol:prolipoprotein diacylglycerol transferase